MATIEPDRKRPPEAPRRLTELLTGIQQRIDSNQFSSESAVREALVLPVLQQLGWDIFDPSHVVRECPVGPRKVDYALCCSPTRREIFIEVKAVGSAATGDRQLFEYAFHEGIPFAVLTDGREWHFFLPGEQGTYDDRRVQKLDLTERAPTDVASVLQRFLSFERVRSGQAIEDARIDYRSRARRKISARTLNDAWHELLSEPDELLMELLSDKTEALCGYRPAAEDVEDFLVHVTGIVHVTGMRPSIVSRPAAVMEQSATTKQRSEKTVADRRIRYTLLGEDRRARNATEALLDILRKFASTDELFLSRLAPLVKTRRRNHIASSRDEVYPHKPALSYYTTEITEGWWLGTNIANREKMRIIRHACTAAGVQFGRDVQIALPNAK